MYHTMLKKEFLFSVVHERMKRSLWTKHNGLIELVGLVEIEFLPQYDLE